MTIDLPEFDVTLKMARKVGSLHTDVEYRTFTVRTPAVNADKAREAAYGLGHGVNDASEHQWKFCGGADAISVEPATDEKTELETLRAQVAGRDKAIADHIDRTIRLERHIAGIEKQCNEQMHQLTAANRRADGYKADERYQGRAALTEYRDANHRHNDRAPGWCICGDDWDGEGCDEYAGLTEAAQLYTGERAGVAR